MLVLKTLFRLPISTHDWFIRLELNLSHSKYLFIKNCLKFWARVSNKSKTSLVYHAYESLASIRQCKENWYSQFVELCGKADLNVNEIITPNAEVQIEQAQNVSHTEQPNVNLENPALLCFLKKIKSEVSKSEADAIKYDIQDMKKSKLLCSYGKNKTHCQVEEYLSDPTLDWSNKQLILQLKQGISHITWKGKVARLRKLEKVYHKDIDQNCQLCGTNDEDVYHVMFECVHYKEYRQRYLLNSVLQDNIPNTRESYLKLFNNLSRENSWKLKTFFNCAMARRELYLREMDEN